MRQSLPALPADWTSGRICAHAQHDMTTIGLTACSGDSWRDTVQNIPMIL
jgi:hypothetical protein